MGYIMYVCPECRKVFKISGSGKKARCTKCQTPYLIESGISEEDWRTFSPTKRQEKIDELFDEPEEIVEFEEDTVKEEGSSGTYGSFFDFENPADNANNQQISPSTGSSFFQNDDVLYDNLSPAVTTQKNTRSSYISEDVRIEPVNEKKKNSKLSIIAAILSIFGCTSVIGLVIAIIDLVKYKDDGKKHIGSWFCIIITSLFFIALIISSGGKSSSKERTADKKTESTVTSVQVASSDTNTEASEDNSGNGSESEDESSDSMWGFDIPSDISASKANALRSAYSYLSHTPFSHDGLVGQLEYEGYSHDDCVYAADNCKADWNEQAEKSARSYLTHSAFSYQGLVEQLLYEQFTEDQAIYGVDHCEADWNEQAEKSAKGYLTHSAFSYTGLIEQLEYEQFTEDQAKYGVDHCEADWNEQAEKSAKSYLSHSSFSHSGLVEQLEYEGYTHEQAEHGVSSTGL